VRRAAALIVCAACAHSLQKPPAIESMAPPVQGTGAELLAHANAAWARRADPAQAAAAEDLYLQAARAEPRNPESYAGAIRAKAFQLGREKDPSERARLAQSAVEVGQLCEENAPASPPCDHWLAAALGLQARERTATAHDALPHMVELLRRAARADPAVDRGGPHRLLALVLLRAPGWPLGPGDPEAAVAEAQSAARIAPDYPPNQLALGEALQRNGRAAEAHAAYSEALRLATGAAFRDDPDAAGWANDARKALR
jgi:tetratricopeptide (TPR) repeat protein